MRTLISHFKLAASAALALCGCSREAPGLSQKTVEPVQVQVVRAKRGDITRSITLPGEVHAYQQATLYAKVAGYLKTITVDKGDTVQSGVLLAEIEAPELAADRARYQAEVEIAELNYKRLNESRQKAPDLVVPETVDEAKSKFDVAKANLDRVEILLHYTKITAPFSGIVIRRFIDPGAFIPAATSGSTAQTAAIVTLSDFNIVRVQVAVPEAEASRVTTGQSVQVTAEGLPGRRFEGKVTRFSYALDDATKTMLVEIELPNAKLELRPGMYATVRIGIETKSNVLLAPADAVLVEKTGNSVFVVEDDKAKRQPVQTGFTEGTNVEIISGATAGQPLILIAKPVSNGQAVTVSEAK